MATRIGNNKASVLLYAGRAALGTEGAGSKFTRFWTISGLIAFVYFITLEIAGLYYSLNLDALLASVLMKRFAINVNSLVNNSSSCSRSIINMLFRVEAGRTATMILWTNKKINNIKIIKNKINNWSLSVMLVGKCGTWFGTVTYFIL